MKREKKDYVYPTIFMVEIQLETGYAASGTEGGDYVEPEGFGTGSFTTDENGW